jgi:hypothetical protein
MQPDVKIAMTIHPEISHEIMEKTFEGHLLAHMIQPVRTSSGYELRALNGVQPVFMGLPQLLEMALESKGELADRMVPVIARAIAEDTVYFETSLGFDELSEALGEEFDLDVVLREICRIHPERHPYFQILWSTYTEGNDGQFVDHGMISGGAQIVTATGIETMNAKEWLDKRTSAIVRSLKITAVKDDFEFKGTTERNGHWYIDLPHHDWNRIAHNEPHARLRIGLNSKGDHYIQRVDGDTITLLDTSANLEKAKSVARGIVNYEKSRQQRRLLESVELVSTSWDVEWRDGEPYASLRRNPDITISADGPEAWVLRDGDETIAIERTAFELHPFLLRHVESPTP